MRCEDTNDLNAGRCCDTAEEGEAIVPSPETSATSGGSETVGDVAGRRREEEEEDGLEEDEKERMRGGDTSSEEEEAGDRGVRFAELPNVSETLVGAVTGRISREEDEDLGRPAEVTGCIVLDWIRMHHNEREKAKRGKTTKIIEHKTSKHGKAYTRQRIERRLSIKRNRRRRSGEWTLIMTRIINSSDSLAHHLFLLLSFRRYSLGNISGMKQRGDGAIGRVAAQCSNALLLLFLED